MCWSVRVRAATKDLPGCRECCRSQRARVEGSPQLRAGSSPARNGFGQFSFLVGEQLCCLLFNCDLYAETDCSPQPTGLPAGLLTCYGYFQPMNLLMKMAFTQKRKQCEIWNTIGGKAKERKILTSKPEVQRISI